MSAPCFERRTSRLGFTLAEIIIVAGLFLVVITAVLFTLHAGRSNQQRMEAQDQSLRACLVAMEHLRSELNTAWVVDSGVDWLEYRVPLRGPNQEVEFGPTGDIKWSEPRDLRVQDGELTKTDNGRIRVFSRLGEGGTLGIEMVNPTLLKVTVASSHGTGYQLTRSFHLVNQF